jgi:uncharacterized protein (TIGR03067 family)
MYQILLIIGCCTGLVDVIRPAPSGEVAPPEDRLMASKDLKKLQGTWERVAMEVEGKTIPDEDLKGWVAIHEADQLTLKVDDKVYRRAVITLNPTRTPKAINTWDSDGLFRDQTLPGIYELKDDTLEVCFAKPGEQRPTDFTTKHGTGFLYCRYKRQKPPAEAVKSNDDCPRSKAAKSELAE